MAAAAACCARVSSDHPLTVGSAATHEHAGHRSCYFNAAFRVNKGHYGKLMLDGVKFWFAGDKGDAKTVELTFEPSATKEQRTAIRVFMSAFPAVRVEVLHRRTRCEDRVESRGGARRGQARWRKGG